MKQTQFTTLTLAFLTVQTIQAQSTKTILKAIKPVDSIQQIDNLKASHPDWDIKTIQFDDSDTTLLKKIVNLTLGSTTVINEDKEVYVLKTLKESTIEEHRVSYIYLSGKDLTVTQIDSLQKVIIKKYENGVPFEDLARNYSMDGNAENGGDLGWFSTKMMVKEFAEPVSSHDHNDIFTIDIPSKQWYYVVLKTHPDRQRIKHGLIKIKSRS